MASVNRVFNTSMEIGVKVFSENYVEGKRIHTNSAYLTFVCVDKEGKPIKAIESIPETEDEKRRFDEALQRRETRLNNRDKQY
jgi:acyl-CoA hydrolase